MLNKETGQLERGEAVPAPASVFSSMHRSDRGDSVRAMHGPNLPVTMPVLPRPPTRAKLCYFKVVKQMQLGDTRTPLFLFQRFPPSSFCSEHQRHFETLNTLAVSIDPRVLAERRAGALGSTGVPPLGGGGRRRGGAGGARAALAARGGRRAAGQLAARGVVRRLHDPPHRRRAHL